MADHQLTKFNRMDIEPLIDQLELADGTQTKINTQSSDIMIITQLTDMGELDAAIRFLSLGLPTREGIWWGYLAAEKTENHVTHIKAQNILQSIATWTKTPAEEHHITAKELAQEVKLSNAASWNAMGMCSNTSNTTPSEHSSLNLPPLKHGHAIANSIILSANSTAVASDTKEELIKQGLHIAMGGNGKISQNSGIPSIN